MGAIIDKITEFIKEMLQGWVLDNLSTMFTDVNDKVGTIAGGGGENTQLLELRYLFHDTEPFRKRHGSHSGNDHQCHSLL